MAVSDCILRASFCLVIGAVFLFAGSTASAHTVDGLILTRVNREFNAATGELRYFDCSAFLMSNGATEGLGAGSHTAGPGLLAGVTTIGDKLVARFDFNGVFTARNCFTSLHTVRIGFENASLDFIGTLGSSSGFLYGTTELAWDNANPVTEDPASVPVGTTVEVRMSVTLQNGVVFAEDMFDTDFGFDVVGLLDCSHPKREGFDGDCNGNSMSDAIDIAESLEADCNDNAVPDSCDILDGTSLDCDGNDVPDECGPDCNTNGVLDECDIAGPTSEDCNLNGIPDECEPGGDADCDDNGAIDLCDLYLGTHFDCDNDGVPNACELSGGDCNQDGTPDDCQLILNDCNANGIPDECDIGSGSDDDCNNNGMPDECELQQANAALDFDGADDIVRIPRSAALEPAGELTVEAWIRPDSAGSYHSRILRYAADFQPGYILAWQQGGSVRLHFAVSTSGGGVTATDSVQTSTYFGAWHHVAGVYSESGGYCRLYVDGEIKHELPSLGTIQYANTDMGIGNFWADNHEGFDGLIDEVRVWAVARTQAQLVEAVSQPLIGSVPDLVGYWTFNEGQGQDVLDSSANANHGWLGSDNAPAGDGLNPKWQAPGSPIPVNDCNNNGVLDECDIAGPTSDDCNENGDPDECEIGGTEDCDDNGVNDLCDLYLGTHLDCDNDGVPNICELSGNDCNANGTPDDCELDGNDCNANGVPDECDIDPSDPDGNGEVSEDCDAGGIPDECEITSGLPGLEGAIRSPLNGRLYLLIDPMNWASAEAEAIALGGHLTTIRNAEENQWLVDTFAPLTAEISSHIGFTDAAVEGQWVWLSGEPVTYTNWASGEPNDIGVEDNGELMLHLVNLGKWNDADASLVRPSIVELPFDTDCNDNGVLDECDIAGPTSVDCNENGVPDECEIGGMEDCDTNGVMDLCDIYFGTHHDCDNDGVPNACELSSNDCNVNFIPDHCELEGNDCNANGLPDDCDIDHSDPDGDGLFSDDCNANSMPDECEMDPHAGILEFDGIDDWCNVPIDVSETSYTVALWFQTTCSNCGLYEVKAGPAGTQDADRLIHLDNGDLLAQIWNTETIRTTGSDYADGTWHQVTHVYGGSVGGQRLYVDGIERASGNRFFSDFNWQTNVTLGYARGAAADYFDGKLADVRIWDMALSPEQVLQNYGSGSIPLPLNLIGHWSFGEDQGEQSIIDLSAAGHDGTLGGSIAQEDTDPIRWPFATIDDRDTDCNDNGTLDQCDIANAASDDCNSNAIPDECEPDEDCNANGVQDICDIAAGVPDCDNDGVPNACELSGNDCNNDGIPDHCEPDCNNNGVADECDIGAGTSPDCQLDGIPDECQTISESVVMLSEGFEHALFPPLGWEVVHFLRESWIHDTYMPHSGTYIARHLYHETEPAHSYLMSQEFEITRGSLSVWSLGCGTDYASWCTNYTLDVMIIIGEPDGPGGGDDIFVGNLNELYPPNDAYQTWVEGVYDLAPLLPGGPFRVGFRYIGAGADSSGFLDDITLERTVTPEDCNGNDVPDDCDISTGASLDCNENAVPDDCDIAEGTSTDVDTNGIPDDCETEVRVMPVATLIDPALTSELRTDLPASITQVHEGSRYYLEIWATDVGMTTNGLSGIYVDVAFCGTNAATDVLHGTIFDFLPEGMIQSGLIDEFGAATLDADVAIEPQWVRVGWIEMGPGEGSPCAIALQPSQNGIGAPGPIDWAFVELGSLDLTVTATSVTYDLDDDGFIGFGDFFLFLVSWLQSVPPADPAHDFDCDGTVGPGDLSWFASGWQKNADDPTILYPVCAGGRGGRGEPRGVLDVRAELVALASPSATDTTTTLPTSLDDVALGATYYLELWVSDVGDVNSGLTSAYFDVTHPAGACVINDITNASAWPLFQSGDSAVPGVIDELGGSVLDQGFCVEPQWARVGIIEVQAAGPAPAATFSVSASAAGTAAYARGLIPWGDMAVTGVSVTQGMLGDIDGDNDVDFDDLDLFVAVLLGPADFGDFNTDGVINGLDIDGFVADYLAGDLNEDDLAWFVAALLGDPAPSPNAAYILAADLNGDGATNGKDIQPFVEALVGP